MSADYSPRRGRSRSPARQRRPRRTRWGAAQTKVVIPGLPLQLPGLLDDEHLLQYLRIVRIEDITRRLRMNDFTQTNHVEEPDRSPSPEPIYGPDGKRMNTRELRFRDKYEDERAYLIDEAIADDPSYRPPADFRAKQRFEDKIYVPQNEFPEINFMGLLIGPRGHTLKKLESETGCKVSIRGKGAYKEGKTKPQPGDDEELHCFIQGDSKEGLEKAVNMINDIIALATSTPEGENELKRQQLRELAMLNGTLRDEDSTVCAQCGEPGHRRFECPQRVSVTNTFVCKICGGIGHVATDCLLKDNPEVLHQAQLRNEALTYEYQNLMAELGAGDGEQEDGEGGLPHVPAVAPWQQGASGGQNQTAPWQQQPSSSTAPWQQQQH